MTENWTTNTVLTIEENAACALAAVNDDRITLDPLEDDPGSYAVRVDGKEVGQILDMSSPDPDDNDGYCFGPDLVLAEWLGFDAEWYSLTHAVDAVSAKR